MSCSYSAETIDRVVSFHGHRCPGLAIGIRAAEYACREFPDTPAANLVCVTETDMCGVDAIQFLTGCTFGKGNLIHRDYGKVAFSFFDRVTDRGIRLVLNDYRKEGSHEEMSELLAKSTGGALTGQERERLDHLRREGEAAIMELPLESLFSAQTADGMMPRPARIMQSLTCTACREKTMETRTRRFAGSIYCIPCFDQLDQKR